MKTFLFVCATLCSTHLAAQTMRYFEVAVRIEPIGADYDWRDSSFIVAASDPLLLADVEAELALPPSERIKHISGPLVAGNGAFNHNGNFWFNWHLAPNQWSLSEVSIELCDGRPYTHVELDTAYWIGVVGTFCPWSSYIKREVNQPVAVHDPRNAKGLDFSIFPNPAQTETFFTWEMPETSEASLTITDREGKMELKMYLGTIPQGPFTKQLSTTALTPGVYVAMLEVNGKRRSNLFVVAR
jgi:hypothetical protein